VQASEKMKQKINFTIIFVHISSLIFLIAEVTAVQNGKNQIFALCEASDKRKLENLKYTENLNPIVAK
jgi:hypothetical protein